MLQTADKNSLRLPQQALIGLAALSVLLPACKPGSEKTTSSARSSETTQAFPTFVVPANPLTEKLKADLQLANVKISAAFLAAHPEEKDTIDRFNNGPIPFSSLVAEMYTYAINSSEKIYDGNELAKDFKNNPHLFVTGLSVSSDIFSSLNEAMTTSKGLEPLLSKVVRLGNVFSKANSLNEFDTLALKCAGIRTAIKTRDMVDLSAQKPETRLLNLSYYAEPSSVVSNSNYAYLDLASGCNFDACLPDVITSKVTRPIILVDTSVHVSEYWKSVSESLGINNITVLNLDVRNVSKETIPQAVGTVRLQNVASWVTGLDETWAKGILDMVGSAGQVVMVQSTINLVNSRTLHGQQLGAPQFAAMVTNGGENLKLLKCFLQVSRDLSSLSYGTVSTNGQFIPEQYGRIVPHHGKPSELFENILVIRMPY